MPTQFILTPLVGVRGEFGLQRQVDDAGCFLRIRCTKLCTTERSELRLGYHFDAIPLGGQPIALTCNLGVSDGNETNLFIQDETEDGWQCTRAVIRPGRHEAIGMDSVVRNGARQGWAGIDFCPTAEGQDLIVRALRLDAEAVVPLR